MGDDNASAAASSRRRRRAGVGARPDRRARNCRRELHRGKCTGQGARADGSVIVGAIVRCRLRTGGVTTWDIKHLGYAYVRISSSLYRRESIKLVFLDPLQAWNTSTVRLYHIYKYQNTHTPGRESCGLSALSYKNNFARAATASSMNSWMVLTRATAI